MDLKKNLRELWSKLPGLGLLLIIFYLISLNYKYHNSESPGKGPKLQQVVKQAEIPDGAVKKYFPVYTVLAKESDVLYRVKNGAAEVGRLLVTTPVADDIIGFGGNIPLFLAVAPDDKILGLELLGNSESPDFLERIAETGFFDSWNGETLKDAVALDVNGVSGASMTTTAVKAGIRKALVYQLELDDQGWRTDWFQFIRDMLGYGVILFAVFSMFMGGRLKKYRWILQVASILILGMWCGYFVSFAMLYGWLLNGVPLAGRVLLVVMVILTFLFPLFLGKAYYCSYLCPFGAAQELAGKIRKKKWVMGGWVKQLFKYSRWVYFSVIIAFLMFGTGIDLSVYEPFSAFIFNVATRWAIGCALFFLLLSVFLSRPWCNYFCLTGQLLEILRRGKADKHGKRLLFEWFVLVFVLILVVFILW